MSSKSGYVGERDVITEMPILFPVFFPTEDSTESSTESSHMSFEDRSDRNNYILVTALTWPTRLIWCVVAICGSMTYDRVEKWVYKREQKREEKYLAQLSESSQKS